MQLGSLPYDDLLPDADQDMVAFFVKKLEKIAKECIARTVPDKSILTYSAGIDSSILAELLRQHNGGATLLTLGKIESSDVKFATQDSLASNGSFHTVVEHVDVKTIEDAAAKVSKLVTVSNLSHFEDCVSFWLAASTASKIKDTHYILSANGPDELFCGYDRFRRIVDEQGYPAAEREILKALDSADILRKQIGVVVSKFGLETREPFLEREFRDYSLTIPIEYKIQIGNDLLRKRIWRCLGRSLAIPSSTVIRRKKAMQYGMGIHTVVLNLVKKDIIDINSQRTD